MVLDGLHTCPYDGRPLYANFFRTTRVWCRVRVHAAAAPTHLRRRYVTSRLHNLRTELTRGRPRLLLSPSSAHERNSLAVRDARHSAAAGHILGVRADQRAMVRGGHAAPAPESTRQTRRRQPARVHRRIRRRAQIELTHPSRARTAPLHFASRSQTSTRHVSSSAIVSVRATWPNEGFIRMRRRAEDLDTSRGRLGDEYREDRDQSAPRPQVVIDCEGGLQEWAI
jgi:hypothetical protein